MNPFDGPPTTPPVALTPAPVPPSTGPGRGRMALVVVATAGLVGGAVVGVSHFASADRPEVEPAPMAAQDDDSNGSNDSDEGDGDRSDDFELPEIDGEIVIDTGDGEPITIDLGELGGDDGLIAGVLECVGFPDGAPFGDEFFPPLEDFEGAWGDDGLPGGLFELEPSVTVSGPDGTTIIEFGEGDGSVTITNDDGELSIETDGDTETIDLEELFSDFGLDDFGFDLEEFPPLGEFDEFDEFENCFDFALDE